MALARGCVSQTYLVLDPIASLPQDIILQIQNLKPCVHILDESTDLQRSLEVPQGDGVAGQTGEFFDERYEGEEVFFDCEVKGVAVLEVDGDYTCLTA